MNFRNLSQHKKNNLIIIGLLAIVAVMAIGYAAFSSQLRIDGTSNITSNFSVLITGIESQDVVGGATNKSEPTFTNTTATFNTDLTSPGDSITYKITVANQGTLDATLSSINIENGNNDAIVFETSGIEEGDNLLKDQTDELFVKVTYSNSVTSQPTNTNSQITVTLNYEQATGGSLPVEPEEPAPTEGQTIYAWNTNEITLGSSTIDELQATKTASPYYETAEEVMSASGYTFFNKYTVVDNVIIEGYACQTYGVLSTPECIQGGSSEYIENNNLIFNTLDSNSIFTGAGGSCSFISSHSSCYVGAFDLSANSYGGVVAVDNSTGARCYVDSDGGAYCNE